MQIHHALICMTALRHEGSLKTVQLRSQPPLEKLEEVYRHNIQVLLNLASWCKQQDIRSLRVSSDLFPLSTHPQYMSQSQPLVLKLLEEMIPNHAFSGLYLTAHPELYISISSLNPEVNRKSLIDLEWHAAWSPWIPLELINIHPGSIKSGFDEHLRIMRQTLLQASSDLLSRLSFENDEISYNTEQTLRLCQELNLMMVLDWHHERCYRFYHQSNINPIYSDFLIEPYLKEIVQTYPPHKIPLFHISSPSLSWSHRSFSSLCKHHDFIFHEDYPHSLANLNDLNVSRCILDVEAKQKDLAIASIGGPNLDLFNFQ